MLSCIILILTCTALLQSAYANANPILQWDQYIIQDWGQSECSEGQRITTVKACFAAFQSYAAACKSSDSEPKGQSFGLFGCHIKNSGFVEFLFRGNKDNKNAASAEGYSLICELPSSSNRTECYPTTTEDHAKQAAGGWGGEKEGGWGASKGKSSKDGCDQADDCPGSQIMVTFGLFGGAVVFMCFLTSYMYKFYNHHRGKQRMQPSQLIEADVLGQQVNSEEPSQAQAQDPRGEVLHPTGIAAGEISSMQAPDQSETSMTVVGIPVSGATGQVTDGSIVKERA